MSKICLIRQPAGIGDIFFTQKIVKDYISKGYTVIWPVIEQFEFIKDYVKIIKESSLMKGRNFFYRNKSEKKNLQFRRSIYAVNDIMKGEKFTKKNIRIIL